MDASNKSRRSPHKRQQAHRGYDLTDTGQQDGAIMCSLEPSLLGTEVESEIASALSGSNSHSSNTSDSSIAQNYRNSNSSLEGKKMYSATNSFLPGGPGVKNVGSNLQRDLLSPEELQSLNLHSAGQDGDQLNNKHSFLICEGAKDTLTVNSAQEFALKLGCGLDSPQGSPVGEDGENKWSNLPNAKVISIIGNTGEGKSYALNRTFFARDDHDDNSSFQEVFSTSPAPESCTMGVWAAYEPLLKLIILDTEGMLGNAGTFHDRQDNGSELALNENHRTRQLLKVLALSDVVIYKSRAERLHTDLFYFLGDASKAYNEHFSAELQKVKCDHGTNSMSMGPTIIIFHETRFTDVLNECKNGQVRNAETTIRDRLTSLNQDISAFSKIRYFGVRRGDTTNGDDRSILSSSSSSQPMNETQIFERLRYMIKNEVEDMAVRSPRSISLIYKTFQSLNTKFSGELSAVSHRSFPDEYFTCPARCSACEGRCTKPMNHEEGSNGVGHHTQSTCIYQKHLENKQYLCLRCYKNGRRIVVVPKASSSEEASWVGLATNAWSGWVLECRICGVIYRSRQHWYGNTSPESMTVVQSEISHIWPGVRTLQGTQNAARRLLDGVQALSESVSTISSAVSPSIVNGSKQVSGWMADRIAPDYWRPNCDITNCHLCDIKFSSTTNSTLSSHSNRYGRDEVVNSGPSSSTQQEKIHHCRACGEGFCDSCSNYRRPVPERGWDPDEPVRVCKSCYHLRPRLSADAHRSNTVTADSPNKEPHEAVQARKYGEKVVGTLNSLASAVLEYPINAIKDSARPSYWVPDDEIISCFVCDRPFDKGNGGNNSLNSSFTAEGTRPGVVDQTQNTAAKSNFFRQGSLSTSPVKLHHCRKCGQGVCDDCSRTRKPVPIRGWDQPVRLCDKCCVEADNDPRNYS